MNIVAVRLVFKVPITWISGYYRLENAKVFSFIPAGGAGNFNIDLKYVTIEVVATMKTTNESITFPSRNGNTSLHEVPTTESPSVPNMNNNSSLHEVPNNITYVKRSIRRKNRKLVCLDVFEVGIHWRTAAFKFDGLWKGFNHLTDFSLNKVGNLSIHILQRDTIYV